jgi:hypothetical protein
MQDGWGPSTISAKRGEPPGRPTLCGHNSQYAPVSSPTTPIDPIRIDSIASRKCARDTEGVESGSNGEGRRKPSTELGDQRELGADSRTRHSSMISATSQGGQARSLNRERLRLHGSEDGHERRESPYDPVGRGLTTPYYPVNRGTSAVFIMRSRATVYPSSGPLDVSCVRSSLKYAF